MRIEKLRFLDDYKCIKKDTEIDFSGTGNYCALVGLCISWFKWKRKNFHNGLFAFFAFKNLGIIKNFF